MPKTEVVFQNGSLDVYINVNNFYTKNMSQNGSGFLKQKSYAQNGSRVPKRKSHLPTRYTNSCDLNDR